MSSRSRKLISHMVIILFFAIVAGVVAYIVGSIFGKSAIAGHDITLNAWKGAYRNLTIFVGFFTWAITCTWYWCAYSVFSIKNPIGVGKRVFWGICGATVAGICIVAPIVYAIFSKVFVLHAIIPVVYLILFACFEFWFGTILATPDNYKYTPIGALTIKASKTRK